MRRNRRGFGRQERNLTYLIGLVLAAVVVWIVSVVAFGYPALIIGALSGVVLAFAWMIGLTASGLFSSDEAGSQH